MDNLFERNFLWSLALYKEPSSFTFNTSLKSPIKIFNTKKIRKKKQHLHTLADPFLFTLNDNIYIFYESQSVNEKGIIKAMKTNDLLSFQECGIVLEEPFHLSYPFVFKDVGRIYLIPESTNNNEISLYKFDSFPETPTRIKTLLKGNFVDSSCIKHNDTWFLFTTSEKGLEIHYTKNLEKKSFMPHPKNPISTDPRFYRCGGCPVFIDDSLYRIAQDCAQSYGKNIHIMRITTLSETEYSENIFKLNYLKNNSPWNDKGGHHLSLVKHKNNTIIITDGKQYDYFLNKIISILFRIF